MSWHFVALLKYGPKAWSAIRKVVDRYALGKTEDAKIKDLEAEKELLQLENKRKDEILQEVQETVVPPQIVTQLEFSTEEIGFMQMVATRRDNVLYVRDFVRATGMNSNEAHLISVALTNRKLGIRHDRSGTHPEWFQLNDDGLLALKSRQELPDKEPIHNEIHRRKLYGPW